MKSRFTCLDVHSACSELASQIVGSRLQNIYDINPKTFLLKLSKKEEDKLKVIIESGTRIHKTTFDFESSSNMTQPNFFTMKLRKWLRDRRITGFRQVGFDRVVHFEFGHQNPAQILHLYVEFYSAGNVILTDNDHQVLLILRVVTNAEGEPLLKLGSTFVPPESTSLDSQFENLKSIAPNSLSSAEFKKFLKDKMPNFSTPMINHLSAMTPSLSVPKAIEQFEKDLQALSKGFLTTEQAKADESVYVDFHSFPFSTFKTGKFVEFPTFNDAVDEFFSKIEFQKVQKALATQEREAVNKLEAIRKEQQNRIDGLVNLIDLHRRRAQAIDANLKAVSDALLVINSALEAGMDWVHLSQTIESEKRRGNPIAKLITNLKLEKGIFTLELEDLTSEEPMLVDIQVQLTADANANYYYGQIKVARMKLQRTEEALEKALKSAEKKIRSDLRQVHAKAKRQQVISKRKHFWFEKFNWFLSSDNFLVISGRDMQQNELLVKRYLKEGDVYVHADIHGASSVIVKNRRDEIGEKFLQVPPRTLSEAGTMSLCHSRAWEAKIVTSAWWVHASQVSKSAPSGEYLPTGSFMIRGKKNFLPPAQLLYGFGFMFVLDETGKESQRCERRERDKMLSSGSTGDVEKYMEMLEIDDDQNGEVVVSAAPLPKAKKVPPKKEVKPQNNVEELPEPKGGKKGSRGAKGKQKKIKQKYADQDEEERQLRMKLLASSQKPTITEVKKVPTEPVKKIKSESVPREATKMEDEDIDEKEVIGEDELGVIDSLCGNLKGAFENALYAIPVCGPITALSSYTFRLKLSPGSMKRGKAVQQALSILTSDSRELNIDSWLGRRDEQVTPEERTSLFKRAKEMIRAVPDSDLNQTMIGQVKIMASAKEITKTKKSKK